MEIISTILGILISVSTIGGITIHFIKKTIKNELKEIKANLRQAQINDCKNYLVSFLADVKNGEKMSVEEVERAYEVYADYTVKYKQNHYVKDQWKRLMKPYSEHKQDHQINRD